jgi:hypothetical protein
MSEIPPQRQFAISEWINDQFEGGPEPEPLEHAPHDLDDYPNWHSDPESGITGDVYPAPDTVYYNVPENPKPEPQMVERRGAATGVAPRRRP